MVVGHSFELQIVRHELVLSHLFSLVQAPAEGSVFFKAAPGRIGRQDDVDGSKFASARGAPLSVLRPAGRWKETRRVSFNSSGD
jgi:hypothetical protein